MTLHRPWMDSQGRIPSQAFQTFGIKRPRTPDFLRPATCEEYDCDRWRLGWKSVLDLTTDAGQGAAKWIVQKSGRQYTREDGPGIVTFSFPPGQSCFEQGKHRVPNMRPALFLHRIGDHRGVPGVSVRRHANGQDWREHMQEQSGRVAEDRKRG